jgi:hypothetical protein
MSSEDLKWTELDQDKIQLQALMKMVEELYVL